MEAGRHEAITRVMITANIKWALSLNMIWSQRSGGVKNILGSIHFPRKAAVRYR